MKWLLLAACLLPALYVHLRGRVRLPLGRQLFDHSTFMAPINVFMYLFSKVPTTPFVPLDRIPELAQLRRNWRSIRDEAETLRACSHTHAAGEGAGPDDVPPAGLNQFYLKWYDADQPAASRLCPCTRALLQAIPAIKVATFVELPPAARLAPHRDPFAGFLRYHLGLATPNDPGCFIEVDGRRHTWRDGEAMVFDETYIHWAVNEKERDRLVLLCDIERPMRFGWAQAVNHVLGRMLMTMTNSPGTSSGRGGAGGGLLRDIGHYRRRFKSWNMKVYRVTVAATIAGLAALLYLL